MKTIWHIAFVCLAALAPARSFTDDFVAATPAQPLPGDAAVALAKINASALSAHVHFLASPALEGRGLGSRGLDAAAEYTAAMLRLAHISPLAESYFQTVPLRRIADVSGRLVVEQKPGSAGPSRSFRLGADFALARQPPRAITAPVVFVGYGIRDDKLGRDDYRGLEVRGAIVVALAGVPAEAEWRQPEVQARYDPPDVADRWDTKIETAHALGAVAFFGIENDWDAGAQSTKMTAETPYFLSSETAEPGPTTLVRVSPSLGDALLAPAHLDHSTARRAGGRVLADVSVSLQVTADQSPTQSRNVVGVIPGAPAGHPDQAVIIGAHLDHLGRAGGTMFPGADDNASGVSALIEIAKSLASLPSQPQRTVIIIFWTGEEAGELGSGFYVRHPLWPLAHTEAYLNLDMIGHPWTLEEIRKLVVSSGLPGGEAFLAGVRPMEFVEPGLLPRAPGIEAALRRAASATGLALHLDRTDGIHGASDYREFARARVPFVRFFGNFFPSYHQHGDTADALDAMQVERVARLVFVTAWTIAYLP